VFADFLLIHGEDPSQFELYFPEGHICRIDWSDIWGRWVLNYAGASKPFLLPPLLIFQSAD
jgi:hypothetical protein